MVTLEDKWKDVDNVIAAAHETVVDHLRGGGLSEHMGTESSVTGHSRTD